MDAAKEETKLVGEGERRGCVDFGQMEPIIGWGQKTKQNLIVKSSFGGIVGGGMI